MKKEILRLRAEGLSYKKICKQLGCSSGTVAYHCGEGQKEKDKIRKQKLRKEIVISRKVENFQFRYDRRFLKDKTEDFQRERLGTSKNNLGKRNITFRWKDVIDKFGWETTCYLTGRTINLKEPKTYHFDHIIPCSKGGDSTIENLGILCRNANQAKSDMTIEELLQLCKEMLQHNGYVVNKEN